MKKAKEIVKGEFGKALTFTDKGIINANLLRLSEQLINK